MAPDGRNKSVPAIRLNQGRKNRDQLRGINLRELAAEMKVVLIDPALYTPDIASPNIGDQIISRAVHRELRSIFGRGCEIIAIPSHQHPGVRTIRSVREADYVFVGGSNLLWFRWWWPASWKIGPIGLAYFRNLILLGVGWGAYTRRADAYGKWVCRNILSQKHLHSVRDSYTCRIALQELKVPFVVNTACPSMWRLSEDALMSTHKSKGAECIFALTDYSKDPSFDGRLIKDLSQAYKGRLLFWPQGGGDLEYCRALGYEGRVIEGGLPSFLKVLSSGAELDYVGTRLHAGILCLEHRVRSLIISVDNRAKEISADTGLPTVARDDQAALLRWLEGASGEPRLQLPYDEIRRWRQQFLEPNRTNVSDSARG